MITNQTVELGSEDGQAPLTVEATVVGVERTQEPDFVGGVRLGLSAQLNVTVAPGTRPYRYVLSRLVGESEWVVDALFGPTGVPHFSHGFGARYLRLRGIALELEDLLDQHARDQGLVQAIGRAVPLVLAEDTTVSTCDQPDRA